MSGVDGRLRSLQALAAASNAAAFKLNLHDADALEAALCTVQEAGGDDYGVLRRPLLAAAAHGMRLVATALDQAQRERADSGSVALCRLICVVLAAVSSEEAGSGHKRRATAQMAALATTSGTGLLSAMQQLAAALTRHYSTAPGRTGTRQQSSLAALTCALMTLFAAVAEGLPNNSSALPALGPAAGTAAALAVAALRNNAAIFNSNSNASSIVGANASGSYSCWVRVLTGTLQQDQGTPAVANQCVAGVLQRLMRQALTELSGPVVGPLAIATAQPDIGLVLTLLQQLITPVSAALSALLVDSNVKQLLLLRLALLVQHQHQQQRGTPVGPAAAPVGSAESQQGQDQEQQPVQPFHKQLFQALGVNADAVQLVGRASQAAPAPAAELAAAVSDAFVLLGHDFAGVLDANSGAAQGAASLLVPVSVLLVEGMLLQPSAETLQALGLLLRDLLNANCRLSIVDERVDKAAVNVTWNVLAQVSQQLVPVLLQQLLPVVRRLLLAPAGQREAGEAALLRLAGTLLAQARLVTMTPFAQVEPVLLPATAVFRQHAHDYCFLMEVALRAGTAASSGQGPQRLLAEPALVASALFHYVTADWDAMGQLHVGSSNASTSSGPLPPPIELSSREFGSALFPTLVSCLKVAVAANTPGAAAALTAADHVAHGLGILAEQARPDSGLLGGCSSRLWCLLLGRCLVAAGQVLQQQQQEESGGEGGSGSGSGSSSAVIDKLSECSDLCDLVLELLPELPNLAAAASASQTPGGSAGGVSSGGGLAQLPQPLLQKLRADHGHLEATMQQLRQYGRLRVLGDFGGGFLTALMAAMAMPGGRPPPPSGPPNIRPSVLGQQLEAFGAAICGLLPVTQCCNYHGCSNLAGLGEIELVVGNMCSGCGAASYCSAACQKAHWRHWHKAVCRRA